MINLHSWADKRGKYRLRIYAENGKQIGRMTIGANTLGNLLLACSYWSSGWTSAGIGQSRKNKQWYWHTGRGIVNIIGGEGYHNYADANDTMLRVQHEFAAALDRGITQFPEHLQLRQHAKGITQKGGE